MVPDGRFRNHANWPFVLFFSWQLFRRIVAEQWPVQTLSTNTRGCRTSSNEKYIQMVIAYGNPPPQQTWRWPDFMNLEGDTFWGSQKFRVQFPLISYQKSGWTRHPKFDRFSVNGYYPETIFSFQYFPVALCSTGRDQRRFFAYPSRPIEGKDSDLMQATGSVWCTLLGSFPGIPVVMDSRFRTYGRL